MRVIKIVFIKSRFTRGLNPNKNNELHKNLIIKKQPIVDTIGCFYLNLQVKTVQEILYVRHLYTLRSEEFLA